MFPPAIADSAGELCPGTSDALAPRTRSAPPRSPRPGSPAFPGQLLPAPRAAARPAGIHLGRPRPLATAAPPPSLAGPWKHRERPRGPPAPRPRGMALLRGCEGSGRAGLPAERSIQRDLFAHTGSTSRAQEQSALPDFRLLSVQPGVVAPRFPTGIKGI